MLGASPTKPATASAAQVFGMYSSEILLPAITRTPGYTPSALGRARYPSMPSIPLCLKTTRPCWIVGSSNTRVTGALVCAVASCPCNTVRVARVAVAPSRKDRLSVPSSLQSSPIHISFAPLNFVTQASCQTVSISRMQTPPAADLCRELRLGVM